MARANLRLDDGQKDGRDTYTWAALQCSGTPARCLTTAWISPAVSGPPGAPKAPADALSLVREVFFDPATGGLIVLPMSELSLLRNAGGESWGGFDTVVAGIAADQSIVRSDALSDWSKFSVGLGHFNSDQHLDAFVGSDLGSNRVLFGDGGGGFAELACSGSLCNDKRDDANHFFLQGDGSRMHSDVFTKAAVVCDINSDGLVSQSAVCGQSAVCKQDHACASIAHECLAV